MGGRGAAEGNTKLCKLTQHSPPVSNLYYGIGFPQRVSSATPLRLTRMQERRKVRGEGRGEGGREACLSIGSEIR